MVLYLKPGKYYIYKLDVVKYVYSCITAVHFHLPKSLAVKTIIVIHVVIVNCGASSIGQDRENPKLNGPVHGPGTICRYCLLGISEKTWDPSGSKVCMYLYWFCRLPH